MSPDLLREVFESRPEVLAHNVETVPRIFKRIRPAFRYERSLDVLTQARAFGLVTKSNLILGMGETRDEVSQALRDLHEAGCELVTITQYLRPSVRHHPVERWVKPEEFVELATEAEEIGFAGVLSGPLVRSSYRAGRLYQQAMDRRGGARTRRRLRESGLPQAPSTNEEMMADERPGLIQGIRMNYRMTKETDKRIGLVLLGAFLFFGLVGFAISFLLTGNSILFGAVTGFFLGLLAVLITLNRRSQRAMYAQLEGEVGAAGRVLGVLRRGWKVEPGVAFNKQQDMVHRVVGPPGIVLVGEGNPHRLKPLLADQRRKHERVVADIAVQEVICGYGEGEVPLNKLSRHVMKLKRTTKPADLTEILGRLKALDAQGRNMPIPKGPLPTSMKGMRGNLRGR